MLGVTLTRISDSQIITQDGTFFWLRNNFFVARTIEKLFRNNKFVPATSWSHMWAGFRHKTRNPGEGACWLAVTALLGDLGSCT